MHKNRVMAGIDLGRVMGLDIGSKRIGVAVTDELGLTAQAVEVIQRADLSTDMDRLALLVAKYKVEKIVVGLPRNMNGSLGESARGILAMLPVLEERLGVPVDTWDERLTTVSAERVLLEADMSRARRKEQVDKLAAVILLQSYLNRVK